MIATTPAVTFVFTDIEGSTRLWDDVPTRMEDVLLRHDHLCASTIEAHRGRVIKTLGDGLHAVFADPAAAVAAVLDLQLGMATIARDSGLPLKVRCGLHAGTAVQRDGDYYGTAVNRAARIAAAAHGEPVLLSQAVAEAVRERLPAGTDLLHLGRVRLRDLSTPENVWQLVHADLPAQFPSLRSLDSTPNNLPQQVTSFVGRDKEMGEVRRFISKTRLLTLTGAGGCGKTRLAIQVAADVIESYSDGVWLVELAPLSDPALVSQALATVLGLRDESSKSLTQTVAEHLQSRNALLVLDNAEHLLDACAQLCDALLRHCPHVVNLVTSRQRLGVAGEQTYRVPSLSMPDPSRDTTAKRLSDYESVRLFIERAQSQLPHFAVTDQNAPALASICARLDGIPLALELAATRIRSLSLEELNSRLDQRFRLLTGGLRTALPRQQTLRALIDWSYNSLSDAEKALLSRSSVFAGGWSLESGEAICVGGPIADAGSMLDTVTSLVDKSLVLADSRDGTTRYGLLETVRQYARDVLEQSGEGPFWRKRHMEHFLAVAEDADPHLIGDDQQLWLERLEAEHDNLRAALSWSCTPEGIPLSGLRLAAAVWRFWLVRGYRSEGSRWLRAVIEGSPRDQDPLTHAKALNGAAALLKEIGDYAATRTAHEQCLAIHRSLDNQHGIAVALGGLGSLERELGNYGVARAFYEDALAIHRAQAPARRWNEAIMLGNLGLVAYDEGDFARAHALYEQALKIFRELGDRRSIAMSLNNLGVAALNRGDASGAKQLHDESIAIFRELGDRWGIGTALTNLGKVASEQGDYASALQLLKEGLAIRQELGERWGVADALEALAFVAFNLWGAERAVRIWVVAERLRREIGAPRPPAGRVRYDHHVAVVRAAVGDDTAFDAMRRKFETTALGEAIDGLL